MKKLEEEYSEQRKQHVQRPWELDRAWCVGKIARRPELREQGREIGGDEVRKAMGPEDTGPYSPCKDLGLCSEMGLMDGSKQRDKI